MRMSAPKLLAAMWGAGEPKIASENLPSSLFPYAQLHHLPPISLTLYYCIPNHEPIHLAEKPWIKVLFADLLEEKNTIDELLTESTSE